MRRPRRHEDTAVTARLAAERDADNPETWWRLGLALVRVGELSGAVAALERVTEIAPDFEEGWAYYGLVLGDLGRTDESELALQVAFDRGTDNEAALQALYRRYTETNNDTELHRLLKRLAELDLIKHT